MLTLAIETSGNRGSLALSREGVLLEERALTEEKRHARTLVADIRALLATFGLGPRDVELVAVSVGPGSFTGLRVGIVCAKAFTYAAGCQIAGVETLWAIAENAPPDVSRVETVIDAQRQELFVGSFARNSSGDWFAERPVRIVGIKDWWDSLDSAVAVTGSGLERIVDVESVATRAGSRILDRSLWQPRAATVARLANRLAADGLLADCWSLEPAYLRKSAAEEKWDTAQAAPLRGESLPRGTHDDRKE